jgi:hypothetical protein
MFKSRAKIKILKYPYPYKAWFTLAGDPDHTTLDKWNEIHNLIWDELKLPFSDSLFVTSYNDHIPNQVNLKEYGDGILKHNYDTIHTWGDYIYSKHKVFTRNDAIEAVKVLKKYDLNPLVWVDHSSFVGNYVKNSNLGIKPFFKDAAGYVYENFAYTFDISHDLGIRYLWDGNLTCRIGLKPDIGCKEEEHIIIGYIFKILKSWFSRFFKWELRKIETKTEHALNVIEPEEGKKLYSFIRYGTWNEAHINGVPSLINEKRLKKLVQSEGVCYFYTHLGKTEASKAGVEPFFPDESKEAFRLLRRFYDDKLLNLSPLSVLLDYIVLKNHVEIDNKKNEIRFSTDGIRYDKLRRRDMAGHVFSFKYNGKIDLNDIRIFIDSEECNNYEIRQESPDVFSLVFK